MSEVAATPSAPEPPEPLPFSSREARNDELLSQSLEDNNGLWLETSRGKFLAAYEPDMTGNPVGALLILHAEGQHLDWPRAMRSLRNHLPEFGWSALAISLPHPERPTVPTRELPVRAIIEPVETSDDTEQAEGEDSGASQTEEPKEPEEKTATAETDAAEGEQDADTNTAPAPPPLVLPSRPDVPAEERVSQRLQAAIAFLHSKGQFNIVLVGSGTGATRAGEYLRSLPPGSEANQRPIRALIMVNGRNHLPTGDANLVSCLTDSQLPVLDLYDNSNYRNQQEAATRKLHARRTRFAAYEQSQLAPLSASPEQLDNQLTRRIRGFLNKHARGVELEDAKVGRR